MGFHDDDDSTDGNYSDVSTDEEDKPKVRKSLPVNLKNVKGFDEDDKGDVADAMKHLLQLRESIGMNDDAEIKAQEKHRAQRDQALQEESRRLSDMSQEDRMAYQSQSAHDLMAQIKKKHERNSKLKKQLSSGDFETDILKKAANNENPEEREKDIRKEMEELRKKKLARKKRRPPRTKSSAF